MNKKDRLLRMFFVSFGFLFDFEWKNETELGWKERKPLPSPMNSEELYVVFMCRHDKNRHNWLLASQHELVSSLLLLFCWPEKSFHVISFQQPTSSDSEFFLLHRQCMRKYMFRIKSERRDEKKIPAHCSCSCVRFHSALGLCSKQNDGSARSEGTYIFGRV